MLWSCCAKAIIKDAYGKEYIDFVLEDVGGQFDDAEFVVKLMNGVKIQISRPIYSKEHGKYSFGSDVKSPSYEVMEYFPTRFKINLKSGKVFCTLNRVLMKYDIFDFASKLVAIKAKDIKKVINPFDY